MNAHFRVNAPDVTYESFETEVLAINLRNGNYYSLRESAVPIWLLAARGVDSAGISRELARSCGVTESVTAPVVQKLIAEFVAEALLVGLDAAPTGSDQPAVILPTVFTAPAFDRYTDMQQLLLMDPIHEVDASGWPAKAPAKHPD